MSVRTYPQALCVAITMMLAISMGWQGDVLAQRVKPGKAAKTTKAGQATTPRAKARATAKGTAKAKPSKQRGVKLKGGFADKHSGMKMNLAGMSSWSKALVNLRLKDGESVEISPKTSLFAALFTRRAITHKGHFSVKDISKSDLSTLVEANVPADKVQAMNKRIGEAQAKSGKKGFFASATAIFRGRATEVKADGLLDATQLKSFNSALGRARNLVTAHRDGDSIQVTAHRRANVFKVKKQHCCPASIHSVDPSSESKKYT